MTRSKIDFVLIVLVILTFLSLPITCYLLDRIGDKYYKNSCDCAKICNSEFKCGLKECPTGKR